MIKENLKDFLQKYSFVIKTELKNFYLYVTLKTEKGIIKTKKLSMKANRKQILEFIELIKKEANYKEISNTEQSNIKKNKFFVVTSI